MFGIAYSLIRLTSRTIQIAIGCRQFHALPTSVCNTDVVKPFIPNVWSLTAVRTVIRNTFPKASEYKRLKKHGWRVKLQTKNGRRQIMRRILKGRYYITH